MATDADIKRLEDKLDKILALLAREEEEIQSQTQGSFGTTEKKEEDK